MDLKINKTILITGGTSGLGLELVKSFLNLGCTVIATGRRELEIKDHESKFHLFRVDFSDLKETAGVTKTICDNFSFDIVVNNAGILSPKEFTLTRDGFEYTYQVNYLAQHLIDEIIIKKHDPLKPLMISAVTSPVYRIAGRALNVARDKTNYNRARAYSSSKLFQVLMCKYLSLKYKEQNMTFFSFVPGVFSSRIYRMQSQSFHALYHIAAPFMKHPAKVAAELRGLLLKQSNIVTGAVYNGKMHQKDLPDVDEETLNSFWRENYSIINPLLS